VASLLQEMGLIKWIVAAVVIAVLAAAVDRVFNRTSAAAACPPQETNK
jgi:hypothetical protein